MTPTFQIAVIIACLFGGWFFAGMETGLISINRLRLHHLVRRKVPGADILQDFVQNPDMLLGTTLSGTNISHTIASTLAASYGLHVAGPAGSAVASALMTLVILVFCEYFAKAWFQSFPAHRSLPFARLLKLSSLVLRPVSAPLMVLVRLMVPLSRESQDQKAQPLVTREEIVHLAGEGRKSGILTPAEHQMIHEVIELKTKTCREVMTPRDKMIYIHGDMPSSELIALARTREVNRFPVYDQEKKNFVGLVHIFDVLADPNSEGKKAGDYMRPPQFVADYTPIDHVLPRMRVTKQPMVLVTDERFETIGLLTIEDVLDEVVGKL